MSFSSLQVFLNNKSTFLKLVEKKFLEKYWLVREKMEEVDSIRPYPLRDVGRYAKLLISDITNVTDFKEFVEHYVPHHKSGKIPWYQVCSVIAEHLEDWQGTLFAGVYQRVVTLKKEAEVHKAVRELGLGDEDEVQKAVRNLGLGGQDNSGFVDENTMSV
jgi:hypothetical protein